MIHQFLIALDQLLNTVIWIKGDGFGYADETLSARAHRTKKYDWFIDTLFFWQKESLYGSV